MSVPTPEETTVSETDDEADTADTHPRLAALMAEPVVFTPEPRTVPEWMRDDLGVLLDEAFDSEGWTVGNMPWQRLRAALDRTEGER
ncbi:MAG: hypothetical protein NVSMB4_07330 [Acidimicrobiales bacterium]